MQDTHNAAIAPALKALSNLCPSPAIALDNGGRIRLWSSAAEALFGWKEGEVLGLPLPMLGEKASLAFAKSLADTLLHQGEYGDSVWKAKTGEDIEGRFRIAEWTGTDGARLGFLLIVTNLSEQKREVLERARLREDVALARVNAEEWARFRELVEAAPDAIVKVDSRGRIVLINQATESLFGYTRDELIGEPVEILVPPAYRHRHESDRSEYSKNPVARPMGHGLTLSGVKKDGTEFPVEISLSPVQTADEVGTIAIVRDVTQRRRIEEQMRAMQHHFNQTLAAKNDELQIRNREVERADRLKSEFLASMSHELRTPLHTVIGFSQLLAEEIQGPLNDRQRRFVDHIHRDSQHLLELINDILDLSKIESGKIELRREVFDAAAEIRSAIDGFSREAGLKSIHLEMRIESEHMLDADMVRFREILINLLSNALKFTPEGGRILVDTTPTEPGFCCFRVQDTGIGIPEGQEEAIFDKFYQVSPTTKGVREGTGLGLSITRHLVEMHGGRIWARSEPGKGSCFSFTMPLHEKQ